MTTRLIKGGRPPKIRDAILAAVMERPGEGLTSTRLAEIVACKPVAACDGLRILRAMGLVTWLRLDRVQLHFAPGPYKDLFVKAHNAGMTEDDATLAGIMEQRRARVLELLRLDLPLGLSAMELAAEIGIKAGAMRHLLRDLVQAGEVWAGGAPRRVRWFGSHAAMESARPALEALEATRKAEVAAALKSTHKAAAEARKAKAEARKANRASKPKPEKKRAMRRDWSVSVIKSAPKPVQERRPVEIIGMDTAKFTPAVPKPDHRFVVSQDHRGEFSALGIGRYAE